MVNNDTTRNRSRRKTLTKEGILEAAVQIADTKGFETFSMRQLGRSLGVEAMAIYHHYKSKDQLREAMLNLVHSEITTPDVDDWREAMRIRADSVFTALERHPWAATLMESGVDPGPATLQDREAMTRCFRKAGFSIAATVHAITLLDIYIYGAAQQYIKLSISTHQEATDVSQHVTRTLPADEYPYFYETLTSYLNQGFYNPKDEFYFGLRLLFDSVETLKK